MNSNPIRTHGTGMGAWPAWVAFAVYLVAFAVLALTRNLGVPVA